MDALAAFAALGQETRLDAFRLLVRAAPRGLPAGEIAARLDTVQNTMSAHLAALSRSGLVRARRKGRTIEYAIDQKAVRGLLTYLMQDCCQGEPELCAPLFDLVKCDTPETDSDPWFNPLKTGDGHEQ